MLELEWLLLDPDQAVDLVGARFQCHYAVQFLPRIARAYLKPLPDDSHTAMIWDADRHLFNTHPIPAVDGQVFPGVRLDDLSIVCDGEFSLAGHTVSQGIDWLQSRARACGLDPVPLAKALHYQIPAHPLAESAAFDLESNRAGCVELARYFANAARLLRDIRMHQDGAGRVFCWPHHFDIAMLVKFGYSDEEERSIGAGLSPGDESYPQPYFYVTPWPCPSPDSLPKLSHGHWHTKGFTAAVLTAEEFTRGDQEPIVRDFLQSTISALSH